MNPPATRFPQYTTNPPSRQPRARQKAKIFRGERTLGRKRLPIHISAFAAKFLPAPLTFPVRYGSIEKTHGGVAGVGTAQQVNIVAGSRSGLLSFARLMYSFSGTCVRSFHRKQRLMYSAAAVHGPFLGVAEAAILCVSGKHTGTAWTHPLLIQDGRKRKWTLQQRSFCSHWE